MIDVDRNIAHVELRERLSHFDLSALSGLTVGV